MHYEEFFNSLQKVGKDPSRLIFEDDLTGIYNRRFLLHYLEHKLPTGAPEEHPVSLLMVDVDNLKHINDAHGHAGGDLALILVARLLKEIAGQEGLPVRYAGDEFMVLLPDTPKHVALEAGERLLERCRTEPLLVDKRQATLQLTLSVGVASISEDAHDGTSLIERADAALYFAKKLGRNRLVNAAELTLQDIPEKAALQSLKKANIVGRDVQLAQVTESYATFSQGHSQFVIVEGAAGMGKTAFLEVVQEALTKRNSRLVKVTGVQQEAFRPYYLATNILMALLNQQPERVSEVFESLRPKQIAYLSHLLPQLHMQQDVHALGDEETQREGIFAALIDFFHKVADFEPVIVLIDDLQFTDEASLFLLRRLLLRDEIPLFVCGASMGSVSPADENELVPLERFYAAYHQELSIRKIVLTPLTAADSHDYLEGLFPRIQVTPGLEQNLVHVTQGNPLFLGEIIRKLVSDQKITLLGQQWKALPVEEGYLPKSLDEIVRQKLAALDEETRELLKHASAIGEDVSVSVLTGSSEQVEAKVSEFVEQSVGLGLVSSEFRDNDEVIRFLGKRVLEITYGSMQEEHREKLHEHLGNYQESLYEQRVLPSASYLAYHFKRSANREKANAYEELQATQNAKIFNAEEAKSYSGDLADAQLPDTPLSPDSVAYVPLVVRCLLTAVRNRKLYPGQSQAVTNANSQLMDAITQVLHRNEHLKVFQREGLCLVNGEEIDATDYQAVAEKFLDFLRSVELETIAFKRGLSAHELEVFLQAFSHIKPAETLARGFWKRFAFKQKLKHVFLTQVKYVERGPLREEPADVHQATSRMEDGDLAQIHEIIRHLLSAAKNIKLYPSRSRTIVSSVEQLTGALDRFLGHQPSLTLGRAGDSLLVNGEKIDISEHKAVADGFLEFLTSIGLRSLTYLPGVSPKELETLLVTFRDLPPEGASPEFWKDFSRNHNISKLLFDEYLYDLQTAEVSQEELPEPAEEEATFDALLEGVPHRANDLLLKGETDLLRQMVEEMFEDLKDRNPRTRQKVVEMCGLVLDEIPMGFIPVWSNLVAEPLIVLCGGEEDQKVFVVIPPTLHKMAEKLVPFTEYLLAARIFSELLNLYRQFSNAKDPRAQVLAKILDKRLEPKTQNLLVEELKSGDRVRQQAAIQVLGSLGSASMYLLIDVIKAEEDLWVRQIAAELLAKLGPKAGEALKRELVLEVTAQGRFRILEVIDTVTQSLEAELAFALGDRERRVRKAAFQLAERLNNKGIGALLLTCASSEDVDMATGAIRCLGKLKPPGATERLISVLNSTSETERAVACCQALGQIADSSSIEALARVVAQKPFLFFGRGRTAQVRGAASFALRQIHPSTLVQVLRPLLKDRDPRVRQVARTFMKRQPDQD